MSRRPSNPPVNSAPVFGNGHFVPPIEKESKWEYGVRSASHLKSLDSVGSLGSLDPDDLFTKHSISEVKVIQQHLRADADAKQEDLRLMVGERYRDLLQASTAIISIAQSSQRVTQALEVTRAGILLQEEPPLPQKPSSRNGSGALDMHLQILQLLSAHMKLLLDAPEHLWRLIERKKFFQAAWLFLLARVVHRALVREDEQDEGSWSRQGVDVLSQFPLIQRQWEVISQFRFQIVHKATLSLREDSSSVEDICAVLLTLHLLDSQPLFETFCVYLTQRSKTLQSKFLWNHGTEKQSLLGSKPNGHVQERFQPGATLSGDPIHEIGDATRAALHTISSTILDAKKIFQDEEPYPSLIRCVLQYIQSDASTPPEHTRSLPADLFLTTQSLLAKLPSSTHFQLLPLNLRSYRPHVDLTSSSTSIHRAHFYQKMDDWFRQSTSLFQPAINRWFAELTTVKGVWSVRSSTRGCIVGSGLQPEEVERIMDVLDGACRHRVLEIWGLRLHESMRSFGDRLDSTILSLNQDSELRKDISRVNFLFQAPIPPTTSPLNLESIKASFRNHKDSLRNQIIGRTSLLNDMLAAIESCAQTIRQDFMHVRENDDQTRDLVERLEYDYKPDADTFCMKIVDKLEQVTKSPTDAPWSTNVLVFLGHVSDELVSSSPFLSDIGCQSSAIQVFRKRITSVRSGILDRWRNDTVSRIVREHRLGYHPPGQVLTKTSGPPYPSSNLIRSLLSLSTSIQEMSRSYKHPQEAHFTQATLNQFVMELTGDGWIDEGIQPFYDLTFLKKLLILRGDDCNNLDLSNTLQRRIQDHLPREVRQEDVDKAALESIIRMQNLLGTLLPHPAIPSDDAGKSSLLLPYGSLPHSDLQFQPAIEVAKPTPRFGLLLVS